jgi:hypothetical protein
MNGSDARAAVANARRNEDGTVTLHAVEGGGHVYPFPAETIHVKSAEAIELLQYEPAAYTLDHHTREESEKPKRPARPKKKAAPPAPPPEPPAAPQPEGPSEQDGSSDSTEVAL